MSESQYSRLLPKLEQLITKTLQSKERVIISVVGKNGTGKSRFGRYVRKNGVGRFDKSEVVVIDDRVVKIDVFNIFRKRIVIPREGRDDLRPFLEGLPDGKKIVFYVNNSPADKLTEADIFVKLTTDEQTRRRRLEVRYKGEPEKLKKYLAAQEPADDSIKYTYKLMETV